MHLRERARALKQKLGALFLALRHKDTPWTAKLLLAITVGYALSPIDLIPDFIPVLGYLDDVLLLPLLIGGCIRLIPVAVMEECEEAAKSMWKDGWPKSWIFAIPVLLIWFLLIGFCLKNLAKLRWGL